MPLPGPGDPVQKAGGSEQERSQGLALLASPDRWADGRQRAGERFGASGPS